MCGCARARCDAGRQLNLEGTAAAGTMPVAVSNLTALQALVLSSQGVNGSLPSELAAATSLTRVSVHDTSIAGTIPQPISLLMSLVRLELFNNPGLSGSLPSLSPLLSLQYASLAVLAFSMVVNRRGTPIVC